ncbi:hypothetical protein P153DRAFT_372612 [Dothidotthia symphoricarpi CBS 119687]|uniref:DH domain-containing protein n=1 Tax=Dothidotthia symphoricarpi CBS 119687 TaxID=1392245 RepID=A0A6A6AT63_9PLEO|nr:uncharacterized protein P153DRAFT_372612 [Dothidotthia symphoricarpi CBS 119687]KAF2134144.1 hypothetical protein P153DRAFT_372612 [Dothidotthia symphoricarpi CBS 119687]
MAPSRPRPPSTSTNGAPPTTTTKGTGPANPRAAARSVSAAPSAASTTRSPPPPTNKVKALAERFERSPGSAIAPSPRARSQSKTREPSRTAAREAARRANAPTSPPTTAATRSSKDASYGAFKLAHTKPRERPQPAPATPRPARRAHGSRSSLDQHISTATRQKLATPARRPVSSGRQPFFGEVVGGQDDTAPGYGIPSFESTLQQGDTPSQHTRSASASATPSAAEGQAAQRVRSPPSRIPVAKRRSSIGSDTGSSTRSVKYTPTRSANYSNRSSPTRLNRKPIRSNAAAKPNGADHSIAYRGYSERGKSSSLAAAVSAAPPTSPRLRNSRERHPLPQSPNAHAKSSAAHDDRDYFLAGGGFVQQDSPNAYPLCQPSPEHPPQDEHRHLSLQTSPRRPLSSATEFEESPVLGIPGSFVLTPPVVHVESEQVLLRPAVFHPASREPPPPSPIIDESELGVRESIPIMLAEDQSPGSWSSGTRDTNEGLQALSFPYRPDRAYGFEGGRHPSGYDGDNSPIEPFANREALYSTESANVGPYRAVGSFPLHSETYSVVNSVLNIYHRSPVITPELASLSRDRVQHVSPVIAQHEDWESKEATETYLARLLSDANGAANVANVANTTTKSQHRKVTTQSRPDLRTSRLGDDSPVHEAAGTAIIYPSQPRYSRGSPGSTTTTIHEDASRSDSSSMNQSRNQLVQDPMADRKSPSTKGIDLPQLAWTNEGLGLSLQDGHQPSLMPPHANPPRPAYSPPPPPSATEQQATSSFHQRHPQPPSPGTQFEQHLARAQTPVNEGFDANSEDCFRTPQPPKVNSATREPETTAMAEQADPALQAKQALIKRYRILEELLSTEHQFCTDMMIVHNIFEATAPPELMSEKEKKILFSNCKELEKLSLSFFRAAKKASKPIINFETSPPTGPWNRDSTDSRPYSSSGSLNPRSPSEDAPDPFENCTLEKDHLTTIGRVFLENKDKMERLYTSYYLNQGNMSDYLKKHKHDPEFTGWVIACFEQVETMTQSWDLDSLLVKPGQRILKYPLLLGELKKVTDASHPDLKNIEAAHEAFLAVNSRINEAKARSDTFRAATSEGKKEKSRGKAIGKTFVKAFIPKPDKTKAYDEADKIFKDHDYKSREQKFGGHFFQLQIVVRDFEKYLDAITEHCSSLNKVVLDFITIIETGPSMHPELESTWRKWALAHQELQNKALEEHKTAVRTRVLKPVADLWEVWGAYQRTIEQRKKLLLYYVKHKQAVDRSEKVDPLLEESAQKFTAINDTLKHELPLLYERTKDLMRMLMARFLGLQKDWYKTCSKKILPLLESEPQHTTSLRYDLESYVDRFYSDYKPMQELMNKMNIINRNLLVDISNMASPVPTLSSDGGSSARNSSSRNRTASMGSDMSMVDSRNRNSGGYGPQPQRRPYDAPPRSSPAGPAYPSLFQTGTSANRLGPGPTSLREARALSPVSDASDATVMRNDRPSGRPRNPNYLTLDGAADYEDYSPLGVNTFDFPPQLGASFLAPANTLTQSISAPSSQSPSLPGSSRTSAVFTSALPMSDSVRGSAEDLPPTPGDANEPEVLFLAASLFEFNIAHDRREGGYPYLVYVPGEIFDVIGMKGELWLARNQDDPTKTVGWIWEKHFARILPEDA